MTASATTEKRLTAQPWAASKEPKDASHDERKCGCGVCAIGPDHAGQRPGAPALPETPAGPRLQQGHADQEHAARGEDDAAESRGGEGPFGQRDQDAGDAVEEDGPRRSEQPGRPRGEDAAEGLAEHPHDEPPADTGETAQARPPAAGCDEEPQPEPDLDPDRRRRRLDRMVGPDGHAAVDEVLDPARRAGGRRLDHAGREAQGHGRLQLEQPVEDPEAAEADAEDPPGGRFGRREARGRRERILAVLLQPPVLDGPHDVEADGAQRAHQEDEEQLVEERRVEGRDDEGVTGLERAAHAGHGLFPPLGRPGGPGIVHCSGRLPPRVRPAISPRAVLGRAGALRLVDDLGLLWDTPSSGRPIDGHEDLAALLGAAEHGHGVAEPLEGKAVRDQRREIAPVE